jgi:nicotinate-nucleotide adenylyltransferase
MSIFCLGGSFNPIHVGHLICARAAAEAMGLDCVTLIPSAQPPHKPNDSSIAPAADRLAMCRLAVAEDPFFAVDDRELHRAGPSYTLDTVRQLRQDDAGEIYWLIGADMLAILPQWHQPQSLLQEVAFVIMARPGWRFDWGQLPREYQSLQSRVVSVPQIDISATAIRRRVGEGKPITYLVPPSVERYIHQHGLYQSNP